jgi:hypothetical protein
VIAPSRFRIGGRLIDEGRESRLDIAKRAMLQQDLIVAGEHAAVAAQRFTEADKEGELSNGAPDRRQGSRYRGGAEAAR